MRRRAERDAPGDGVLRLRDDVGDVEECLGRDAAAIETHAAGVRSGVDERDRMPRSARVERRRVAAGAAADDDELRVRRAMLQSAMTNGCFERLGHPPQESRGVGAVDHAVIVGERQRQHQPRLELLAVPPRLLRAA